MIQYADLVDRSRELALQEHTQTVHFAIDGSYIRLLCIEDSIRSESANLVRQLQRQGLMVSILTGDEEREASRVSAALGVQRLTAGALPDEKKRVIQSLQAEGEIVAMVGDGWNDLPAQAVADVGVQLSLPHTSSVDMADMVIMSPNLLCLPQMLGVVRRALAWSQTLVRATIFYNVSVVTVAAGLTAPWGITITPSTAAALMSFSSVLVLSLALLLR